MHRKAGEKQLILFCVAPIVPHVNNCNLYILVITWLLVKIKGNVIPLLLFVMLCCSIFSSVSHLKGGNYGKYREAYF